MKINSIKEELQNLNVQAEVNIWLDSYDDIFSDFDSNPYSEKTLSDDFISQAKKISKNKLGKGITLHFFIPLNKRNKVDEKIISTRLNSYFNRMYEQLNVDIKRTNFKGLLLSFIGISLMIIASYLSFIKSQAYYTHLLLVLFEPAGWFLLWAGLDNLVYNTQDQKKELIFYSKMTYAKIEFLTLKNNIKN